MNLELFNYFFDCCVGKWQTERTYHYLTTDEVERSHTDFIVNPLTEALKLKVMADNQYNLQNLGNIDNYPGFNLEFNTVSEQGERVSQNLNLMFIPKIEKDDYLEGDYLRDQAYQEAKPIVSHFRFNCSSKELLMTTNYTRIVSVDSITLINPTLRIRKIINYVKPEAGQGYENVALVGFGVEKKSN
jgi:CpeS-like protein